MNITLIGTNGVGKTLLLYKLQDKKENPHGTLVATHHSFLIHRDDKCMSIQATDTKGFRDPESWTRFDEYFNKTGKYIVMFNLESSSFVGAVELVEELLSREIKNENIMLIMNLDATKKKDLNKRAAHKFSFQKEINIYESDVNKDPIELLADCIVFNFIRTRQEKIKLCIVGSKNSPKNAFYESLTNQNYNDEGIKTEKLDLTNQTSIISIAPYFDANNRVRYIHFRELIENHVFIIMTDPNDLQTTKELIDICNKKKIFCVVYSLLPKPLTNFDSIKTFLAGEEKNEFSYNEVDQINDLNSQKILKKSNYLFEENLFQMTCIKKREDESKKRILLEELQKEKQKQETLERMLRESKKSWWSRLLGW